MAFADEVGEASGKKGPTCRDSAASCRGVGSLSRGGAKEVASNLELNVAEAALWGECC